MPFMRQDNDFEQDWLHPEEDMREEYKLAKVTLEYESGLITSLSGEDAKAWMEAVNVPIVLAQIRSGQRNKQLEQISQKWVVEREASPKPSTEEG